MGFWLYVVVSLVMTVVGELLRPKMKINDAKPSSLGDFDFPTADATRCIPIWCGKVKFDGPNTAWFGDLRVEPITKKVKTGWFSSDRITQGYRYFLGVQMIFGFGKVDQLFDFRLDNKSVLGSPVTTDDTIWFRMNRPYLLGNDDPPNGVSGPVTLYRGTGTQPASAYLKSRWNELEMSRYPHIVHAVFEQCYLGNSDTPPPPSMIAGHYPNSLGLADGKHRIGDDANAAAWCYEIITNELWGMGRPTSEVNVDSFIECGLKLHAEELGISMLVERPMEARAILAEVLRHVDGVIFNDPQTGEWTMKLARDDYNVNDLIHFDNSNILPETFELSRMSWEETKNHVIVNYIDHEQDFTAQAVVYQDPANLFIRGGQVVTETYDFTLFTNKRNATKVAARMGRVMSAPSARVQFKTDRTGYRLLPGDVFKLSKPDYGINGLIMRVIDISYGTMQDPAVTVTCTEDIFAVNAYAYGPPEDTGWVPTYQASSPLRMCRIVEVPYEMIDDEKRRLMVLGVRDDFVTQGFDIWMLDGGEYRKTGTAYGTLAGGLLKDMIPANLSLDGLTFTVRQVTDIQLVRSVTQEEQDAGRALLMVNNEIMAYRTAEIVDDPVLGEAVLVLSGVYRGMYDTIPATHLADSHVYFFNESVPLTDAAPFASNGTYTFKLPTFNGKDALPLDAVPAVTGTVVGRAQRPNPVGPIRINGVDASLGVVSVAGEGEITWEWRNKAYLGPIVKQGDTGIPREPGSGVRIQIAGQSLDFAEGQPAFFKLPASGSNIAVSITSVDFDGQLASVPRTAIINYSADGSDEAYIRVNEPEADPNKTTTVSPVGGVLTLDCDFDEFVVILSENVHTVLFDHVPDSKIILLEVRQQGEFTISWPANVNFIQGTPYVVTPGAGAVNLVGLVTLNKGATWNLKASQPGSVDGQVPMIVSISPSAPFASASGAHGSPVTASVQVTASVANGLEPITYSWSRADGNGGPNFAIDDPTIANPTFSLTRTSSGVIEQQWVCNVGDADGSVAQSLPVPIRLETQNAANNMSVDFDLSPPGGYAYARYPSDPAVTATAVPSGGIGPFSYQWAVVQGAAGVQYSGFSQPWIQATRPNNNVNSTRTVTLSCTVTDLGNGGAAVVGTVNLTLDTGRSGEVPL